MWLRRTLPSFLLVIKDADVAAVLVGEIDLSNRRLLHGLDERIITHVFCNEFHVAPNQHTKLANECVEPVFAILVIAEFLFNRLDLLQA